MPALSINGVAITGGQANLVNSNGISFGMNGSSLTASHNGITAAGGVAISAAGASQSSGTVVFSNSNGLSFGMNGSTVTGMAAANYASAWPLPYQSVRFTNLNILPQFNFSTGAATHTTSLPGNVSIMPFVVPTPLTVGSLWMPMSVTTATALAATLTASYQQCVGIYSMVGSNFTTISTEVLNFQVIQSNTSKSITGWWGTNSTSNTTTSSAANVTDAFSRITGCRWFTGGNMSGSLAPGQYFWGWIGAFCISQGAGTNFTNNSLTFGYADIGMGIANSAGQMGFSQSSTQPLQLYGILPAGSTITATNRFVQLLPASFPVSSVAVSRGDTIFAPAWQLRYTS